MASICLILASDSMNENKLNRYKMYSLFGSPWTNDDNGTEHIEKENLPALYVHKGKNAGLLYARLFAWCRKSKFFEIAIKFIPGNGLLLLSRPSISLLFDMRLPMSDHVIAVAEALLAQVADERAVTVLERRSRTRRCDAVWKQKKVWNSNPT